MAVARFYGEVTGSASTSATRIGVDRIYGHIRGWQLGAEVTLFVNEDGQDELVIRVTGGSKQPNEGQVVYRDSTKDDEHLLSMGGEIRIVLAPRTNIRLDENN